MVKNIELTVEQAKELYSTNPEYRTTLLVVFTDKTRDWFYNQHHELIEKVKNLL